MLIWAKEDIDYFMLSRLFANSYNCLAFVVPYAK